MSLNRDGPHRGEQDDRDVESSWSFGILLDPSDLPGGHWRITEERSWPTGQLDPESEKSRRAMSAGGVTAWRCLEQPEPMRSAWVEVVPYASAEDAQLSLGQVPRYFVGTAQSDEVVLKEQVVEDRTVPGVSDTWIFEKSTNGPNGVSLARYVAGTVDRLLFITCFSGQGYLWPWAHLISLAALQAERARGALGSEEDA